MFDWSREVQSLLRTANQRVFFCGSNSLYHEFVESVRIRALHGAVVDAGLGDSSRACSLGAIDAIFTDGSSDVDCAGGISRATEGVFGVHWEDYRAPPCVSMCVYLQSINLGVELQPEEMRHLASCYKLDQYGDVYYVFICEGGEYEQVMAKLKRSSSVSGLHWVLINRQNEEV